MRDLVCNMYSRKARVALSTGDDTQESQAEPYFWAGEQLARYTKAYITISWGGWVGNRRSPQGEREGLILAPTKHGKMTSLFGGLDSTAAFRPMPVVPFA